jgi:endoglucanase
MSSIRENEVVGFLRADGKRLVNGEGREVLLRGVGFGSWLLPEGYMWMFPEQGDRPRRIEKMIQELIGEREAERFWDIYYDVHTSEADIQQIAAEGFNSVRVPINARFLIEDSEPLRVKEHRLKLIDRLIGWCRKHSLYVILDLHGAPGGQTGTNIDDSERNLPELFTEEHNRRLTVQLWRFLAEHYKDEWIVAGYDLLNEPLPNWFSAYNGEVMPLYRDIVKVIREVDDRHLIILEGAHWATDWSIFTEKFDDNLMLQFHKYWNNPDAESVRVYLEKREEWNVPIYMGEGGENNKAWYAGAFRLFEDHNISWNFWTWKKMGKDNSPCSVKVPRDWQMLVEYLEGGAKPDEITAQRILWEYLDNLAYDKCVYYRDVVDAMLSRPPVRIPAIFYGYRGEGVSYGIQQPSNQNVGFRINDCTDIRFVASARETANFEHGKGETWQDDERLEVHLAEGDWLAYEIYEPKFTDYTLYEINLHLNELDENGSLAISVDGENKNVREPFTLEPGTHRIVIQAKDSRVRLEWLEIIPTSIEQDGFGSQ